MDSVDNLESAHVRVLVALETAERVERNVRTRATARRMRAVSASSAPPPEASHVEDEKAMELPSLLPPPPRAVPLDPSAGRYELIGKRVR